MNLEDLEIQSYILYKPDFLPSRSQHMNTVTLEQRIQINGTEKWGIFKASAVLDKSIRKFAFEGMPSTRTEKDLRDTRFSSPQKALDFWKQEIEQDFDNELRIFYNIKK